MNMNLVEGWAMEKTGVAGSQLGGVMAVVGHFTLNDLLAIAGFALAFVSVVFQVWATWYFKSRHLKIAEARLAAELEHKGSDDDDA